MTYFGIALIILGFFALAGIIYVQLEFNSSHPAKNGILRVTEVFEKIFLCDLYASV
ncbi:MAG: hypothetical protein H8E19_00210 [Deltaproteobacteria bacterium]|uniref:Uncharacterized protein n=1 Tax=Candidatus Desulfacyla euxinica TaxID=2841693 RepID=A0A8J6MWJ2_9DELT|nr:hypothetical protein [Candidatus Desulfacyla euxinica]